MCATIHAYMCVCTLYKCLKFVLSIINKKCKKYKKNMFYHMIYSDENMQTRQKQQICKTEYTYIHIHKFIYPNNFLKI